MLANSNKMLFSVVALLLLLSTASPVSASRRLAGEQQVSAEDGPAELVSTASILAGGWEGSLLSGYLTNAQLAQWSSDFVSRCNSIARRFSIGKSIQGEDLWVVEVSTNPGKVEAKPNFKYVANMHGDEPGGRMLLPMLAEWLCKQQTSDPRAMRIINGMHLFLMPTMNPDGFTKRRRYNAVGADLNRDFPSVFQVCKGKQPESCDPALLSLRANGGVQPETAAIMKWSSNDSWPFTAAANLHEGAIVTNYPWDGYTDQSQEVRGIDHQTTEQDAYVFMSKAYSLQHPYMGKSPLFRDGITNGAGWYPIYGSMQDWDYTAASCMAITLELSQDKYPAASTLAQQWADNVNSLLNLPIASVLGGVSGTVTDTDGTPIKGAVVTVDGVLMKGSARGPFAYYNKPLAPGSYTVRVSAPGHRSATATVTVPASGQGVKQDFRLARSRRAAGGAAATVAESAAAAATIEG